MKVIIQSFILIFCLYANYTFACYVPPAEQHTHWKELISRTDNIYLAKVISLEVSENWYAKYTFKTIKVLKGQTVDSFIINGIKKHPEEVIDTNDNHTSPFFWAFGGRSYNGTDCQISPTFEKGDMYLVFKDQPYHNLSFEKIESMDDLWLRTVNVFLTGKDNY